MAQQRLYLGNVIADPIGDVGDSGHPVYFLDGVPIRIESVASANVAARLGTETVGSDEVPVYLDEGVPKRVEKVASAKSADTAATSVSADHPTRRALPVSADVDALYGDGAAGVYSSPTPTGLANLPGGVSDGFFLEVVPTTDSGETEQRLTETGGAVWYRHWDGGAWSDWVRSGGGSGADTHPIPEASGNPPVDDPTASSGKVVQVVPETADSTVSSIDFPGIPFGLYSVVVRAKSTVSDGSNVLFTIVALAGDAEISSYPVKESDFTAADRWESLGVGVDFSGSVGDTLRIELRRGEYAGTGTVSVDYVQVAPSPVALNALS